MEKRVVSRRRFLERAVTGTVGGAAAVVVAESVHADSAKPPTAVDLVPLGKTGLKICRLGFGTGSLGGKVQRELGQEGLNRLVQHAYDRGIRFFDTADSYRIQKMVGQAIRKLPREKLWIQSKMRWAEKHLEKSPQHTLERFLTELRVDYIDSLLIHCTVTPDWPEKLKRMRDAFSEMKEKKLIRVHGTSCHGLPGLRASGRCDWVDVQLARVNPQGHHVDGDEGKWAEPGKPEEAFRELRAMKKKGRGIIGMKLIGNGDFRDPKQRERSIRFAMTCGFLDAVVIGFASPAEVDEAIERMNQALAARR